MSFRVSYAVLCVVFTNVICQEDEISNGICANHHVFESLHSCANKCGNSSLNATSVDKHHKIVYLSPSDVPKLQSKYLEISRNDDEVRICYPFDDDFFNCGNMTQLADKFVLRNDSLTVEFDNKTFPLGRFYLANNDAVICLDETAEIENVDETDEAECSNHHIFASLDSCIKACSGNSHFSYSNATKYHKIIEIPTNEFSDVSLESHYSRIDSTDAITRICYPLDEDFIKCRHWSLDNHEFVISNDSLHLIKFGLEIVPVGHFFLDVDDAVVCQDEIEQKKSKIAENWFLAAHIISAVSLVTTFILALLFPKLKLRKNYTLLCHMSIMSVAYLALVIEDSVRKAENFTACMIIAFVKQFAFLASFFWINVQAIDLYVRFNRLCVNSSPETSRRRFFLYSSYAWGVPFTVSCVTLIVDKSDVLDIYRPSFSLYCWFGHKYKLPAFIYFYLFIAAVLVTNIVLFALTIAKLSKISKNVSIVNRDIHKQLFQLYSKLFIVMGMCWIMEVISWGVGGPERNWYFTDFINGLQGFFMLLIYIVKPVYVRRALQSIPLFAKWFPKSNGEQSATGMTNAQKETTEHVSETGV